MKVTVNGEQKIFNDKMTLSQMLTKLKLSTTGIIIERNLEIVNKSGYDKVCISDGDKIELIKIVGGG